MHTNNLRFLLGAVTAILLGSVACGGSKQATQAGVAGQPEVKITAADRKEAEATFKGLCATCHGPKGQGNGPASAALDPKPRNFTLKSWQSSVTDAHIEKIIVLGGAAVGKSPAMPANPQFRSKPGVVAALREHVRSLGAN